MEQEKFDMQICDDFTNDYNYNAKSVSQHSNIIDDPEERERGIKACCYIVLGIGNIIAGLLAFSTSVMGIILTIVMCGISITVAKNVLEKMFVVGKNDWSVAGVGIGSGVATSFVSVMILVALASVAALALIGFIVFAIVSEG